MHRATGDNRNGRRAAHRAARRGGRRGGQHGALRVRVGLSVLVTTVMVAAVAYAIGATGGDRPRDRRGPTATTPIGSIAVGNSHAGRAVLTADDLLPGDVTRGSVQISNPNRQPLRMSLAPGETAAGPLARALRFTITERRQTTTSPDARKGAGGARGRSPRARAAQASASRLFTGPLSRFGALPLRPFRPGEQRTYNFAAALPDGAPNSLQGASTSLDLNWRARAAGPPPECKLRAMRARFFVFRKRDVIRLVSRYKAAVGARIIINFFERGPRGRRGRPVGRMVTRFQRSPRVWRRNRVAIRRTPAQMHRFRHSRRGYTARLRVSGAPGYCSQYLNLDLTQLKRFFRQYVWFQRGSFRTR